MKDNSTGFFYWITQEDVALARNIMGPGAYADLRFIRMLATIVVGHYLSFTGLSYEIVDAGTLVVGQSRLACMPSHPFASSFFIPEGSEPGWIAVVQLDLERRTGRFLGWYKQHSMSKGEHAPLAWLAVDIPTEDLV